MTGGCTCPIYYRGVVSVENGSVIIRCKLAELIKTVSQRETALLQPCFKHDYGAELNLDLPQPCFKHDMRVDLSDILTGSC